MVFFEKSQPVPKITSNYNTPEVVTRLEEDFHNKCYICEQKQPSNINIEHFIAHKGDKTLQLDWSNLFLSCGHCNNVKESLAKNKIENFLNCTILEDRVDSNIYYKINPFPKEKAIIEVKIDSKKAQNTKDLIDRVFNGENTPQKKLESSNLRAELLKEIRKFQELLFEYEEYSDESILNKIKFHLNNKSAFTAFKRWIIRDNKILFENFGKYIIN
jgi:uncharacterized protein (TIGR02646 family)